MNRANLEKLASYLEGLPSEYEHFDMFDYARHRPSPVYTQTLYPDEVSARNLCGTVACAIGHGPMAGIVGARDESWTAYERRVFGLVDDEWEWCFSPEWRYVDNTPQGAAKRIREMLENGVPPKVISQRDGTAPYMFATRGA